MFDCLNSQNYIVISNRLELEQAKNCDLCNYIIEESGNCITIYNRRGFQWNISKFVFFGKSKEKRTITGLEAYQNFYKYCGKEYIEKIKNVFSPMEIWASYEQLHFFNSEFSNTLIEEEIYEFDCNSSFSYGAMALSDDFYKLKEYLLMLYENKKKYNEDLEKRTYYKNLQNYLIGYFARIKKFISLRSEIIRLSNNNIYDKMTKIILKKGRVFLSNTDSIITDKIGAEVLSNFLGDDIGEFKLERKENELFYKSSNAYQLGSKLVYSGVSFFAQKHTDLIKGIKADVKGTLIKDYDFFIESITGIKLCRICRSEIIVTTHNRLGEFLGEYIYKLKE